MKISLIMCTISLFIGCGIGKIVLSQLVTGSNEFPGWDYHMNTMSFNCHGLVNPSKTSSLRRLINFNFLDVVLL